jgi:hypothetical protein
VTDEDRLAGQISEELTESITFASRRLRYGGEEYDCPDEDEWEALGEDPSDPGCPLILRRVSDGKFFEVDIDVTVWETTPRQREEQRAYFRTMASKGRIR